ncbi:lipopolysaccharide-modifying enzyme [Heliothis virescens ascovirus 3j]|uniref:Lipopolysaccharide-modifying enzyme n=1 Tax=Heliothis virescens ascovirus 3j TaxID=1561067 RepID=A0A2Z5V6Z6_9VIRU|nr:lipopolysaccharide-modifying enzyme [Heliothis virescens ascovirus 3j]
MMSILSTSSSTTPIQRFVDTHVTPTSCNGDSNQTKVLRTKIFYIRTFEEFRNAYDLWYGHENSGTHTVEDMMSSCEWYVKLYKKLAYACVRHNTLDGIFFIDECHYNNWWTVPSVMDAITGETINYGDNRYEDTVCRMMNKMTDDSNRLNRTRYRSGQRLAKPQSWFANGHILRMDDDANNLGDAYFVPHVKQPCGLISTTTTSSSTSRIHCTPGRTDHVVTEWLVEMLQEVCVTRRLADVDFLVNYRDHPICVDSNEPGRFAYDANFRVSHDRRNCTPPLRLVEPLSVCSGVGFRDRPIPNQDDWERLRNSAVGSQQIRTIPWHMKKPVAVFRGSSTGAGVCGDASSPFVNRRMHLARMSVENPTMIDAGITKWNLRPRVHNSTLMYPCVDHEPPLKQSMTYDEQSTFKYIIHMDGHVAAFRLAAEMFTDSLILKCDSKWNTWFEHMLKPMVHYVPIKDDLSDLLDKIRWCRDNDAACEKIAAQAREFAVWNLCRRSLMNHLAYLINGCTLMHDGSVHETASAVCDTKSIHATMLLKRNEAMLLKYRRLISTTPDSRSLHRLYRYPLRYSAATSEAYSMRAIDTFMYGYSPVTIEKHPAVLCLQRVTNNVSIVACADGLRFAVKTHTVSGERTADVSSILRGAAVAVSNINILSRELPLFPYTIGVMYRGVDGGDTFKIEVYTEYIKCGTSFYEFISGLNSVRPSTSNRTAVDNSDIGLFDLVIDVCTQVYVGLRVADERHGFRHNGLSDLSNILVRRLEEPTIFTVHTRVFGSLAFNTTAVATILNYDRAECRSDRVGSKNISYDWGSFLEAVVSRCVECLTVENGRSITRMDIENGVKTRILSLIEAAGGLDNNQYDALPAEMLIGGDPITTIDNYATSLHANGVPWMDATFEQNSIIGLRRTCEMFLSLSAVIKMAHECEAPDRITITLLAIYNQYKKESKVLKFPFRNLAGMDAHTYAALAHCLGTPPLMRIVGNHQSSC